MLRMMKRMVGEDMLPCVPHSTASASCNGESGSRPSDARTLSTMRGPPGWIAHDAISPRRRPRAASQSVDPVANLLTEQRRDPRRERHHKAVVADAPAHLGVRVGEEMRAEGGQANAGAPSRHQARGRAVTEQGVGGHGPLDGAVLEVNGADLNATEQYIGLGVRRRDGGGYSQAVHSTMAAHVPDHGALNRWVQAK
jgi:hypothetical protein